MVNTVDPTTKMTLTPLPLSHGITRTSMATVLSESTVNVSGSLYIFLEGEQKANK
jgi:hypothetical protein